MTDATGFHPVKLTALYRTHLALGAKFREEGMWRWPEAFTAPDAEVQRVRASVGLADASPLGKLDLKGHALDQVLEALAGAPPPAVHAISRISLRAGPECLCCRLARDELLLLTAPSDLEAVTRALHASPGPGCAHLTDLTSALAVLDLVGPNAPEVLSKVVALDLRPAVFPALALTQGGLAGVHALILRLDLGRTLGYRLLVGREVAEFVWDVLWDAGAEFGLVPFGETAHALLRAEEDP
ncbi:MAG: sarcosine oxidase subunit gamma family protein [Candidatus Entotheonellia bacterium]